MNPNRGPRSDQTGDFVVWHPEGAKLIAVAYESLARKCRRATSLRPSPPFVSGVRQINEVDQIIYRTFGVFDFQYSLSMKGLQNSLTHFCLFYDTKSCLFYGQLIRVKSLTQ